MGFLFYICLMDKQRELREHRPGLEGKSNAKKRVNIGLWAASSAAGVLIQSEKMQMYVKQFGVFCMQWPKLLWLLVVILLLATDDLACVCILEVFQSAWWWCERARETLYLATFFIY